MLQFLVPNSGGGPFLTRNRSTTREDNKCCCSCRETEIHCFLESYPFVHFCPSPKQNLTCPSGASYSFAHPSLVVSTVLLGIHVPVYSKPCDPATPKPTSWHRILSVGLLPSPSRDSACVAQLAAAASDSGSPLALPIYPCCSRSRTPVQHGSHGKLHISRSRLEPSEHLKLYSSASLTITPNI